jgi:hypothetical protein
MSYHIVKQVDLRIMSNLISIRFSNIYNMTSGKPFKKRYCQNETVDTVRHQFKVEV